jgi:hypothetical protein
MSFLVFGEQSSLITDLGPVAAPRGIYLVMLSKRLFNNFFIVTAITELQLRQSGSKEFGAIEKMKNYSL